MRPPAGPYDKELALTSDGLFTATTLGFIATHAVLVSQSVYVVFELKYVWLDVTDIASVADQLQDWVSV